MRAYKFSYTLLTFNSFPTKQFHREAYFSSREIFLEFLNKWNGAESYKYFESAGDHYVNVIQAPVDYDIVDDGQQLFYGIEGGEQSTTIKVREA